QAAPSGGVRVLIAAHLAHLSPTAQTLAKVAAAIGPAFDVDLVREVGGWAEGELLDALDELLDHRLVREASGRGRYDYTSTNTLARSARMRVVPRPSGAGTTNRGSMPARSSRR